jgi:hypothetical protein
MRTRDLSIVSTYAPPILVLLVTVSFLLLAYTYEGRTRQVPVLVGWILLVLCVLDVIAASATRIGYTVKAFFGGATVGGGVAETADYSIGKVILAILWPTAFVALVVVVGFVVSIPIYVFLFVAVQGLDGIGRAALASIITTACIYVLFEILLKYEIYRGILFTS